MNVRLPEMKDISIPAFMSYSLMIWPCLSANWHEMYLSISLWVMYHFLLMGFLSLFHGGNLLSSIEQDIL